MSNKSIDFGLDRDTILTYALTTFGKFLLQTNETFLAALGVSFPVAFTSLGMIAPGHNRIAILSIITVQIIAIIRALIKNLEILAR